VFCFLGFRQLSVLETPSSFGSPNLVLFLGAVFEGSQMMLMAEYLENGRSVVLYPLALCV
jgi:hypothetical protein